MNSSFVSDAHEVVEFAPCHKDALRELSSRKWTSRNDECDAREGMKGY